MGPLSVFLTVAEGIIAHQTAKSERANAWVIVVNGYECFVFVVNEPDRLRLMSSIKRVAAHCGKTDQALVIEISSLDICVSALREALTWITTQPSRPPAVSVVVAPMHLNDLERICFALAIQGEILAGFSSRELALIHARRERDLVLAERSCCSASKLRIVRSTSANARF